MLLRGALPLPRMHRGGEGEQQAAVPGQQAAAPMRARLLGLLHPAGQNGIHQVPYEILSYLTFVDDEDRNGTLVFWCCLLIARLSA